MNAAKNARLEYLLSVEFLTPFESAELDSLIDEGFEESQMQKWEREQAQTLWAENGGYRAGLHRPL